MTAAQVRKVLLKSHARSKVDGQLGVTDAAIAICEKLAEYMAIESGLDRDVKVAVHGFDDGDAEFLVRCEATRRSATFFVWRNGSQCKCVKRRRNLTARSTNVDLSDPSQIHHLSRWVQGSDDVPEPDTVDRVAGTL